MAEPIGATICVSAECENYVQASILSVPRSRGVITLEQVRPDSNPDNPL